MAAHLCLIKGRWYYKRRVPADVVRLVGAKVWQEALRTSDKRTAETKARALGRDHDSIIDVRRRELERERTRRHAEDLDKLLPPDERIVPIARGVDALKNEPADYRKDLESGRRLIVRRNKPEDLTKPRVLMKVGLGMASFEAEIVEDRERAPGLNEIVSRWAQETEAPPQHVEQYRYVANRFIQLHGDLPLGDITKAHIRDFKDAIGKLPNSTRADIREATLHDAIRLGAAKGLPPITTRTVTKHVTGLATLLRYAEGWGFIETNPAAGIRFPKVKGKISDRERRKPFSRDELATLFAAIDAAHGATEDDYWIPRIALYHGLRVEEVCQLSKDDVHKDGTTWVISVNDSGDKKVKNESSARTVPLHPTIIAEGFLKHRDRSTGPRLFATLAPDGRGRLGGPYGKRFARILREKAKITDKSRTFHSLRHRFADACRNAEMPHEVMARLMGHTVGSRVSAGYGTGESVSVLASWLGKVQPL